MTSYLIKKMVSLAAVLFLVSLTVFSVLFVLPGDPAQIILGINASPETLAALKEWALVRNRQVELVTLGALHKAGY